MRNKILEIIERENRKLNPMEIHRVFKFANFIRLGLNIYKRI